MGWEEMGKRLMGKSMRELFGVLEILYIFIVVVIWVYIFIKVIKLYTQNKNLLLYKIYTSIKLILKVNKW